MQNLSPGVVGVPEFFLFFYTTKLFRDIIYINNRKKLFDTEKKNARKYTRNDYCSLP